MDVDKSEDGISEDGIIAELIEGGYEREKFLGIFNRSTFKKTGFVSKDYKGGIDVRIAWKCDVRVVDGKYATTCVDYYSTFKKDGIFSDVRSIENFIETYLKEVEELNIKDQILWWRLKSKERKERGLYKEIKEYLPQGLALDAGCGTGSLLEELEEGIGVDIVDEYLKDARALGHPLVKAEVLHMPFRDNIFDSVSYVIVLRYLFNENLFDEKGDIAATKEKKISTLREAHRIMKTNGTLVVVEESKDNWPYIRFIKEAGFEPLKDKYLHGFLQKIRTGKKVV